MPGVRRPGRPCPAEHINEWSLRWKIDGHVRHTARVRPPLEPHSESSPGPASGRPGEPESPKKAVEPERVDPRVVERRLRSGHELLLVCAYEADSSFEKFPLEGAIPRSQLASQLSELSPEAEIVFYCRCPEDSTATAAARELAARGFSSARVLAGGYTAWTQRPEVTPA